MKYFILIWESLTVISCVSLLHFFPLLLSCCSIHIFLLASFPFTQPKAKFFPGVLTSTWALDTLSLQRNICQNIHTSDITLSHKNPSHLTILEGNAQAKPLGLEFQIPQILCKSIESKELRPGSSWLNHSREIHLHICICIKMYILI